MEENYKVYTQTDSNNRIIAVNSDAFLTNVTDWILIDKGQGDRYHHAQGNYFKMPLTDMQGCHNYIYENESVKETTEEEKAKELSSFPTPEPTPLEQAQSEIETNLALSMLNTSLLEDALSTSESRLEELEQKVLALQG